MIMIGSPIPTTVKTLLETVLSLKGWDRFSSLQKNPRFTGSTQNLRIAIGIAITIRTKTLIAPIFFFLVKDDGLWPTR